MNVSGLIAAMSERLAPIQVDTEIRTTPRQPYYLITAPAGMPADRRLTHEAPDRSVLLWVMAVSNNPRGAIHLAERAVSLLDGWWPDAGDSSGPMTTVYTAPVIDAGDAPGDWRWSCTSQFRHQSGAIHV